VQSEIDENVDSIFANHFRSTLIGYSDQIAPVLRSGMQFVENGIAANSSCIGEDLVSLLIVMAKEREQIAAQHMVAKIGGNITNPKRPLRRRIIRVRLEATPQRLGMPSIPFPMLTEELFWAVIRMIVQRKEQIAVELRIVAPQGHGFPMAGQRFIGEPRSSQSKTQIPMRIGEPRLQFDRPPAGGNGFVDSP
jgi:hypothetical protein